MAEGGGFLAGDSALRKQAKHLREGAVHACGGGEIAAGGIEFGKVELAGDEGASRVAEQLVFSIGVIGAERGVNVRAGHGALASVGKHELATVGQGVEALCALGILTGLTGIRAGCENFWRNMVGAGGERFRRRYW